MSQDSSQEKTEDATPKRLRDARKKGQVPKSKDVSTIIELIFLFGLMAGCIGYASIELQKFMKMSFEQVAAGNLQGTDLWVVGKSALLTLAKLLCPFFTVGVVIAVLVGFLQVGPIFALDPLKPQMKKLNMLEGMKNWFKAQTFIELVKNVAKIFIVFYLAYHTVKGEIGTILQTTNAPLPNSLDMAGSIIFSFVLKVLIAFLAISVIDFIVQKKQFMKQMRMSKDEVKREYKQDEGDPLIKGHRKQMHREFAFSDAKQAVKQSDVVVANPVHVAIAIQYDRQNMSAPVIVLKGQRIFADMIRQIAEEENIPIMRNVPLAWALYDLPENSEIPEDLYTAVAEILSYVYKMKQAKDQADQQAARPSNFV